MKNHEKALSILKNGLQTFVEVAVKQHHDKLLGKLEDSSDSGYTRFKSCNFCNRQNLKPKHAANECPSQNYCFCKSRRRERRPCPNEICDFIYEGIIEDHAKCSPNLKTTDISQWTDNYWEIASCYMKHRSESAEKTELLDLLHLVVNNRFILKKFLPDELPVAAEKTEEKLSKIQSKVVKVIKVCLELKRSTKTCSADDIEDLCLLLAMIQDKNAMEAENELAEIATGLRKDKKDCRTMPDEQTKVPTQNVSSRRKHGTTLTDKNIHESITHYVQRKDKALTFKMDNDEKMQISIEQVVDYCRQVKKEEVVDEKRCRMAEIIGDVTPGTYIVTKADEEFYHWTNGSSRWDVFECFVYKTLKYFLHLEDKSHKDKSTYSYIYVVSEAFAKRVNVPLETLAKHVRTRVKQKRKSCLIILDVRDKRVSKLFEDYIFGIHTVIKMVHGVEKGESSCILRLHSMIELTIKKENAGKIQKKSKEVQECLYKCIKKLGKQNVSMLTLENICFDNQSTKIRLHFLPNLKVLRLKSCIFTPGLPSSLEVIELEDQERRLSDYAKKLSTIFPATSQSCHSLEYIKTTEMKIGSKEIYIKLIKNDLEVSSKKYFEKTLQELNNNQALQLLENEISKQMSNANCNYSDFEQADDEDRKAVLQGMCYALRASDENLIHVHAAEFLGSITCTETVLVCYMEENFDADEECVWGNFRGFKTYKKSYYSLCSELQEEKYDGIDEQTLDNYFKNDYRHVNETIREHSKQLMEDHSNLEIIGVSFGRSNGTVCRVNIAFYVRLKSFVPYGEELFPKQLTHPTDKTISFKTVVLEDFFVPLADSQKFYALERVPYLAMGCSIGSEGNDKTSASIGPFVEYKSNGETKTGFLTASHLFSLPDYADRVIGTKVVQPSEADVFVNKSYPNQETSTSSVCGIVVGNVFDNEVDASLVEVTDRHPKTDLFINCRPRDLANAGFSSERGWHTYKDGSYVDLSNCVDKKVVKFGCATNLTTGKCILEQSVVRVRDFPDHKVRCPSTLDWTNFAMSKQFEILSIPPYKQFCDYGDSGAGVFLVNDDNSLSCVGIVIGLTHRENTCIATPISRVLNKLSKNLGSEITLKKFTS